MALKFLMYNVKGLNSIQKRWLALKEFKASKADIILVQETHFRPGGSLKFASKHFPTCFLASDPSGKAGVAILINRLCPLRVTSSHLDPQGRFIILNCSFLTHSLTIVNVYAPNSGQISFLSSPFDTLGKFSQPFMVIGGDFNVTMSPDKDRRTLFPSTSPSKASLSKSFRKLRAKNLLDIMRIKHPTLKQFTFYSHSHKLYSRLDHFFISTPLLTSAVSSEINPITWSDHCSIHLDIHLSYTSPKNCHWRLNEMFLHTPEPKDLLSTGLTEYFQLNVGTVSESSTLWEAHKAVFRGQCIAIGS